MKIIYCKQCQKGIFRKQETTLGMSKEDRREHFSEYMEKKFTHRTAEITKSRAAGGLVGKD